MSGKENIVIIKPSVPTVPQEWIDKLYEKQMAVVAAMTNKWLLHPTNTIKKVTP